jgi:hypothetical protein
MRHNPFCLILPAALLLAGVSCNLPGGPASRKGTLTLLLPETGFQEDPARGSSRSVLSDTFRGTLNYRLTFTGPGGTLTRQAGGGGTTVSLEEGTWTITAAAYDPGAPAVTVGNGSASVAITAGVYVTRTISMAVDPAYEAGLTEIYIHNEAELRRIGTDFGIDGSLITRFYLENDITLTRPWTPIGTDTAPFKAVFDGNGKTITINSFTSAALDGDYLGLFGYIDGAVIENLKIRCDLGTSGSPLDLSGTGNVYVGALAGYADNGSELAGITVSGSIYVNTVASAFLFCGGIVGRTEGTSAVTIENSSFTGILWGKNTIGSGSTVDVMIGGIAGGSFSDGGMITACYVSGRVEGIGFSSVVEAGGITGNNYGTIERCYAWTLVSAQSGGSVAVGGIAGYGGAFSKCYALGTVTGTGGASNSTAGGITGYAYIGGRSKIVNCAALNTSVELIGGSSDAHRILGDFGVATTRSDNFALSSADMTVTPASSVSPSRTGLDGDYSAFPLLADFAGPTTVYDPGNLNWDFGSDWHFIPGYDYPVPSWQTSAPADPASL